MPDSVQINDINLNHDAYRLEINGRGHPTEFIEACREIAIVLLRKRWRWWFQGIQAHLPNDVQYVSEMDFNVLIKFGD